MSDHLTLNRFGLYNWLNKFLALCYCTQCHRLKIPLSADICVSLMIKTYWFGYYNQLIKMFKIYNIVSWTNLLFHVTIITVSCLRLCLVCCTQIVKSHKLLIQTAIFQGLFYFLCFGSATLNQTNSKFVEMWTVIHYIYDKLYMS